MDWSRFEPPDFEYDFETDELWAHRISLDEAIACFYNEHDIRPNRRYIDRFQLTGGTDGRRKLKIIVQLKPGKVVRIITGWDI